jgi:hypothetical protein
MINAGPEPRRFRVQEGEAGDWVRIVDTGRPGPEDIAASGEEVPLESLEVDLGGRSVVVLSRRVI